MNPIGKKIFGTALAAVLMIGSTGVFQLKAEAASPNGWQKAYKTYIQNYVQSDNFGYDESFITLVDLDRDGSPELFVGRTYRTVNSVDLAYTFKDGKAKPIQHKGLGLGSPEGETKFEIGMSAFIKSDDVQGLRMFKHNKTGNTIIIGRDGSSGAASGEIGDYTLNLSGTTLTTAELSKLAWDEILGPGKIWAYTYTIRGKKVTKATYDKNRSNYYASLKGISSGIQVVNGRELVSEDDIHQVNNQTLNRFLGIK